MTDHHGHRHDSVHRRPTTSSAEPNAHRHRSDKKNQSPRKIAEENNPDFSLSSIGNYLFVKTLGEGNFAKVKLARHKLTSQEVAVKIIDKTQLDGKKLHKLYREVRIMKLLHHPNIVCLYEVIETKSTLFLVMEYASGGELYDYLVVHGRMKEKEAKVKFRQIMDAVKYCHGKRVIHRDLKAENLLLDANFDIKIADFGFSNLYDPTSKLDTFCGSPPYAAPELFQGRKYTGPEVDVWSLGVILYVLTTGCLPFDGKNLQEMRESVCRGKYRIPFYLSEGCEKLLRRFLVRDPSRRSSLEIIMDDPWLNDGNAQRLPVSPTEEAMQRDGITEDDSLLQLLEAKYHVDREQVLRSIRDNVYDDIAALYYLLYHDKLKKKLAAQQYGPASSALPTPAETPQIRHPPLGTKSKDEGPTSQTPSLLSPPGNDDAAGTSARKRTVTVAAAPSEYRREHEKASLSANYPSPSRNAALQVKTGYEERNIQGHNGAGTSMPASAPPTKPENGAADIPGRKTPKIGLPNQVSGGSSMLEDSETDSFDTTASPASARKRTNTIVGILRSRRATGVFGKDGDEAKSPGDKDKGSGKPRSLRFTFSSNTTSSRPPDEIVQSVVSACQNAGIEIKMSGPYLIECLALVKAGSKGSKDAAGSGTASGETTPAIVIKRHSTAAGSVEGSASISARLAGMSVKVNPEETATAGSKSDALASTDGGDWVKFEIEICKLPRLKNLHGLKFKRLFGASSDYKDVCEQVLLATVL